MLVLIDGHSITYRTWYANRGQLERPGGEGLLAYMVLRNMVKAAKEVEVYARKELNPTFVRHFVCWDRPSSRDLRRRIWDGYKGSRKPIKNLPQYIDNMRKTLEVVHPRYALYGDGLEADDLLALIATITDNAPVAIITTDSDLHQLLIRDNVRTYHPFNHKVFDRQEFTKESGFGPEWLPLFKATVGDTTDDWKGINNFGPAAFKKAIDGHKSPGEARKALVEQYGDVVNTGYELCALPIAGANFTEALDRILSAMNYTRMPDWEVYLEEYNIAAMEVDYVGQYLI